MSKSNNVSSTENKKDRVNQESIAVTNAINEFPGYLLYPADEGIYNSAFEEENIDLEDLEHNKSPNTKSRLSNKEDLDYEIGKDLYIPYSELDDADKAISEEYEENNYYSLVGDNNNHLEENIGVMYL